MRIAIIAPSAMPARRANTIQTAKMAQAFARLGHEVLLIAPSLPSPLRGEGKGGGEILTSPPPQFSPARGGEGQPSPLRGEGKGGGEFLTSPPPQSSPVRGEEEWEGKGGGEILTSPPPQSSPARGEGKGGGEGWQSFAHHYGLSTPFEIAWLTSNPSLKRYDFALRAVLNARAWHADLIYTRLPQAAALSSLIGMKTIFEMHDLPQGKAKELGRIFLAGKGACRLVVISQALAGALIPIYPQLKTSSGHGEGHPFLIVAPDGVDLERFSPWLTTAQARQKLKEQGCSLTDQFIAGYTGHLYPGRGIELIQQLALRFPEVLFLLIGGEDPDLENLQTSLSRQQIQNIRLGGFIPNAILPLYQMACDVLLMPYQEHVAGSSGGDIANFLSPLKLFEYLASGRPILASDLQVFREILNEENSILLPPKDLEAWQSALVRLIEAPQKCLSLGQSARLTAELYTWEERARKLLPFPPS